MPTARPASILRPALFLAAIALVASGPADARRVGGGRSVGMQRSVSTPHATPDAPTSHLAPTVTYSRAVGEARYGGSDLPGDVARVALRSRYLEEQSRREAEILERRRAERALRGSGRASEDEAGPNTAAPPVPPWPSLHRVRPAASESRPTPGRPELCPPHRRRGPSGHRLRVQARHGRPGLPCLRHHASRPPGRAALSPVRRAEARGRRPAQAPE